MGIATNSNGRASLKAAWPGLAPTAALLTALMTLLAVVFAHGKSQARLDTVERELRQVQTVVRDIDEKVSAHRADQSANRSRLEDLKERVQEISQQVARR